MDNYPGSDLTQIDRFIRTALAAVRYAHLRDKRGLESSLHQLMNIGQGWILSCEIELLEEARQMQMEFEMLEEQRRGMI